MTPEFKAKFIEALESGKYKQGRGYNKRMVAGEDTIVYCPWGLLLELAGINWSLHPYDPSTYVVSLKENDLNVLKPFEIYIHEAWAIMKLNDVDNKTFAEIAQYVRENF